MVRCGQCQALFYLCRRDDRGQRYCPGRCQELARQRSRKEARRRHQRSELGRLDHCDAQRRYRARRVMDQGSKKLARTARVCRASAPDPSMVDATASDARTHETHDEASPMHSATEKPPRSLTLHRQVAAALHRATRAATHPPQHLASVRCAVCSRPGRFVREGFVRPPRRARRGRRAHARAP
jgi:hypothetical protein